MARASTDSRGIAGPRGLRIARQGTCPAFAGLFYFMAEPLRPHNLNLSKFDGISGERRLMLMKVAGIYRYLTEMGYKPPPDATIDFEEDCTPLEIDITSWHPVVVRRETFDPQQEPWVRFA